MPVSDNRLAVTKNNAFDHGCGFGLMRQFIFMFAGQDGSDGEAERVSRLSRVWRISSSRDPLTNPHSLLFTHKM
jgi:hypothetical protein